MAENMIKFLRGNVANLPQTATEGALYFTKDEGVYLGLADGSYHRYGDFITVSDVASLPAAGAHETCMYYCVAENILAKWDGSTWVQINKQKTLAELGGVAKSVYEAKMALLEQADADNASAIANLETYVGTIPEDYTETNIVAYINKKAEETLNSATGGSSESAASVLAALNTYKAENDPKVAANTTAAANAQAAADAAKAAADAAQADVDALEEKVGTVEDGKTVVGLIAEAKTQADKGVADAATAQAAADAIAADYLKSSDKTELQGNIDKKVDKTTYDAKVATLESADTTLQGNINAEAQARKDADDAQVARIATLEGQITGLSGAMHFEGVKEAIPADVSGYEAGDVIIVGEKEYVFNGTAFVEFGDVSAEGERIASLEGIVGKAAEGDTPATGLVKGVADNASAISAEKTRAEGAEAALSGRLDTLEAIDHNAYALKTAVAADKTELQNNINAVSARVKTIEDKNISDGANKVEASTTNGNIKIDGVETVVYTHPAAHAISEVTGLQDALDAKATVVALNATNANVTANAEAITALQSGKADKATTLAGYGITDAYTKTETYTQDEVNALLTWGSF